MIIGNLLGVFLVSVLGLGMNGLFIGAGLITAIGTIWALRLVPDAFIRLLLILFSNTFYKLRIIGAENVPSKGGALLVPNHVSFVDGLFLVASIDRPVRFIVESSYFQHPIYGPFLRAFNAIEVSSSGGPRVILKAMRDAGEHIDAGHLVCIFGEGQITRTGQMQPFKRGLERIVKGRDAPIIPVNLDGVWGSIFSHERGRFLWKIPRRWPYPVSIHVGEPQDCPDTVEEVRDTVLALGQKAENMRDVKGPAADTVEYDRRVESPSAEPTGDNEQATPVDPQPETNPVSEADSDDERPAPPLSEDET